MLRKITIEVFSILLIMLFLYAAISKWLNMRAFEKAMYNQPFSHWLATLFIWTVPATEVIISILLMIKRTQLIGLKASFILMCLFTLYIGSILLHFFPRVPCSCGGVIQKLNWPQHLVFNLFFILISLWAILLETGKMPNFKWVYGQKARTA